MGQVVRVRLAGPDAEVVLALAARERRSVSAMGAVLIGEALEARAGRGSASMVGWEREPPYGLASFAAGEVASAEELERRLAAAEVRGVGGGGGVVRQVSRAEVEAAAGLGPAFDGQTVREPPTVKGGREVVPDPKVKS